MSKTMSNHKYNDTQTPEETPLTDWARALVQKEISDDLQVLRVEMEAPLSEELLALKAELLGEETATSPVWEQLWNNVQTQVVSFLSSLQELAEPSMAAGLASDGAALAALEEEQPFQPLFQSDSLGVELRLRQEGVCLHFLGDTLPTLGDIEVYRQRNDDFARVRCDVLEQLEDELLLHLGAVEEMSGQTVRLAFPHAGETQRSSFQIG